MADCPETFSGPNLPNPSLVDELAQVHGSAFAAQQEQGWSRQAILDALNVEGTTLWVSRNGGVAGFAIFRQVLDEAELLTLAVNPVRQRSGIAGNLLSKAMAALKKTGCKRLFLEVREDNGPAKRLYDRCGFMKIATRKNYYNTIDGKTIDAEVYSLEF